MNAIKGKGQPAGVNLAADSQARSEPEPRVALPRRELGAFLHAARVVQGRSSRHALLGLAFYVVLTLALVISALMIHNSVRAAERLLVLVTAQPLHAPLIVSCLLIALYLAVAAAVQLAHERDRGTLDVLLFGPANEGAVLLGIFAAHVRLYVVAMLPSLVWVGAAALILNITLSFSVVWLAISLLLAASVLVAFALLTACLGGRARTAIASFLVVALLLAVIQLSDQLVALAVSSGMGSDSLVVVSRWLERLSTVTRLISPFALVAQGSVLLAARQYAEFALTLVQMGLLAVLLLAFAAWLFRRKRGIL